MTISNKAKSFLEETSGEDFAKYISPGFFDSNFMESQEASLAKKALVYSALAISKKNGPQALFQISFREAESFLRDDPREFAWEGVLDQKKWFETIILEIQREYFDSALMSNKIEIVYWGELELKEKIERMEFLIDNINSTLDTFNLGSIELFSVEENEVCVNDLTQYVAVRAPIVQNLKELVFECLAKYINFSFQSRLIKLVAQ